MFIVQKLIFVFVLLALSCHLQAQTKIAIIADKGLENYSDLLTVELSKQKDVSVVERAEIDKVLKEQEISIANSADNYLKVGTLLKADGLVMIKKYEFQKKEFLVSRLVAVNQGVVLSAFSNPLPPEKTETWPTDISAKFAPYLNKLSVSQDKAVPISILNIRAPIDTPEMRLLEKEFTLALAFRLIQEKDLFILERWKMEKLAWEKDIDTESSPFWTGSYLLDGSIELSDKENVKVKVRLRKPAGEESTLEATGTRLDLSGITEKLTGDLLKEIGKTQDKIPWDSAKEADQYLKESDWAFKAGLFEESFSAVQAARTLGNNSEEALFLEVKAAANCTYPTRQPEIWMKIDLGYDSKLIDVSKNSRAVDCAILSMELLKRNILDKIPEKGQSFANEKKWREIAERTILNASIVLRAYYDQGCVTKDSSKSAALRKMVREAYLVIAGKYFNYGLSASIFEIKAAYIPLWYDNLEEILQAYKDYICSRHIKDAGQYYYEIRKTLIFKEILREMTIFRAPCRICSQMKQVDDPLRIPYLIDWDGKVERKALEGMWNEFTDSLCVSGDLKARYAGLYIKAWMYRQSSPNEKNKYLMDIMDLCWKERTNIIDGKSDIPVFSTNDFDVSAADKEEAYQYLFKYVKFILEESSSRKIAKHSANLPDVFSAWLKDSTPVDAKTVLLLLDKYRDTIKESLKSTGIYDFTITYNNEILKKHPQIQSSKAKGLMVSRIWNPYEAKETAEGRGFQILHISGTASGGLSLICSYAVKTASAYKLVFINPDGSSAGMVDIPCQNISSLTAADVSEEYAVLVIEKNKLLTYDIRGGRWSEREIFEKKYACAKIIGETAFIAYNPAESGNSDLDAGIIKVYLKNGKSEILVSSKRNPSQSPLDNSSQFKVEEIMEVSPGVALVVATFKDKPYSPRYLTYGVANGGWGDLFSAEKEQLCSPIRHKIFLEFFSEGGDFYGRYTYGGFMVLLPGKDSLRAIYLHYNNNKELPELFKDLREWRTSGQYLKPANRYLCYDGKTAFYYTETPKDPGPKYLIAFPENGTEGIPIRLEFDMGDQQFSMMNERNAGIDRHEKFSNNTISGNCVWLKEAGLFIKSCNSKVLWFIPQTDIDDYIVKYGITEAKDGKK